MEANYDYTHFLYLEDDEQFRFGNLEYFLNYRGKLSKYGLIPGFARVEWSSQGHCLVNTDNIEKQDVSKKSHVIVGDVKFIHLDNPYMGMFLLDKELILEYVKTKSFHIEESKEVWPWEVRERAAMGLMFENVPLPFEARCVIALSGRSILPQATIRHLSNNYADDPDSQFGKIPMSSLLTGEFDPSYSVREPRPAWPWKRRRYRQ